MSNFFFFSSKNKKLVCLVSRLVVVVITHRMGVFLLKLHDRFQPVADRRVVVEVGGFDCLTKVFVRARHQQRDLTQVNHVAFVGIIEFNVG